jgi:hypothetical protein
LRNCLNLAQMRGESQVKGQNGNPSSSLTAYAFIPRRGFKAKVKIG